MSDMTFGSQDTIIIDVQVQLQIKNANWGESFCLLVQLWYRRRQRDNMVL